MTVSGRGHNTLLTTSADMAPSEMSEEAKRKSSGSGPTRGSTGGDNGTRDATIRPDAASISGLRVVCSFGSVIPLALVLLILPWIAILRGDVSLPAVLLSDMIQSRAVYRGAFSCAACFAGLGGLLIFLELHRFYVAREPALRIPTAMMTVSLFFGLLPSLYGLLGFDSDEFGTLYFLRNYARGEETPVEDARLFTVAEVQIKGVRVVDGGGGGSAHRDGGGTVGAAPAVGSAPDVIVDLEPMGPWGILRLDFNHVIHCIGAVGVFLNMVIIAVIFLVWVYPASCDARVAPPEDLRWKTRMCLAMIVSFPAAGLSLYSQFWTIWLAREYIRLDIISRFLLTVAKVFIIEIIDAIVSIICIVELASHIWTSNATSQRTIPISRRAMELRVACDGNSDGPHCAHVDGFRELAHNADSRS